MSGNASLNADVLKVGHHGLSYSSTNAFVKAVSPKYAVISCVAGNQYGHPDYETLVTLNSINANVYITKSGSKYHSLDCQYLKKYFYFMLESKQANSDKHK